MLAQEEARILRHDYIGSEHLLLGLLREKEGVASRALEALDVTVERARAQVVRIRGSGDQPIESQIPFTPRAKHVFELAARDMRARNAQGIDTEDILLSLVDHGEGVAARILIDFGVDADSLRAQVERLTGSPRGRSRQRRAPPPEHGEESKPTGDERGPRLWLQAVRTHPDRPASQDELGRRRLAEILAERMRRVRGENTERPVESRRDAREKLRDDRRAAKAAGSFMIHVHAAWGAGKSSLLNFLAVDLRNRSGSSQGLAGHLGRRRPSDANLSQWVVVEFNAWEHQRLEPPWWWLLAEMRRAARSELWWIDRSRWALFLIRDWAWRAWNARVGLLTVALMAAILLVTWQVDWFGLDDSSLVAVRAAALTVTALGAVVALVVGYVRGTSRWLATGSTESSAKFLRRTHDPLDAYRRRFRWLVRSSGRPIAVFVDDLDRCEARYVVELLEGMQTVFADEPVIYVVAADRRWLCDAYATVYSDFVAAVGEPGRPLGFLFIEKTFQISMEIPPLSHDELKDYWTGLTGPDTRAESDSPAVPSERFADVFADARSESDIEQQLEALSDRSNYEDVLRAAMRKLNSPELLAQLEDSLKEFVPLVENNPRSMKRLVNAYGIERDRLLRERRLLNEQERKQLVLFTILRLRWPVLAEHLLKHPGDVVRCLGQAVGTQDRHQLHELFEDADVQALFRGDELDVTLDHELFLRYSGRSPSATTSVGT